MGMDGWIEGGYIINFNVMKKPVISHSYLLTLQRYLWIIMSLPVPCPLSGGEWTGKGGFIRALSSSLHGLDTRKDTFNILEMASLSCILRGLNHECELQEPGLPHISGTHTFQHIPLYVASSSRLSTRRRRRCSWTGTDNSAKEWETIYTLWLYRRWWWLG